jgi:hypothetical protein
MIQGDGAGVQLRAKVHDDDRLAGIEMLLQGLLADTGGPQAPQEALALGPLHEEIDHQARHDGGQQDPADVLALVGHALQRFAGKVTEPAPRPGPQQCRQGAVGHESRQADPDHARQVRRDGAEAGDELGDDQ